MALSHDMMVAIGSNIRKQRNDLGLTIESVAERICVTPSYLGLIERGHKLPSTETLILIAEALNVGLDTIVFGNSAPANLTNIILMLKDLDSSDIERIERMIKAYVSAT